MPRERSSATGSVVDVYELEYVWTGQGGHTRARVEHFDGDRRLEALMELAEARARRPELALASGVEDRCCDGKPPRRASGAVRRIPSRGGELWRGAAEEVEAWEETSVPAVARETP